MDYKYIEQLMERYWRGETSVKEEDILRAFFSQEDIPASMRAYREVFTYADEERKTDILGDDFDSRMLAMTEERKPVKARTISITHKLMPLFKAAAIVAFVIVIGDAAQVAFNNSSEETVVSMNDATITGGQSVAMADSVIIDTLKKVSRRETPTPLYE